MNHIVVKDDSLHYNIRGSGEPVVFLHGYGICPKNYGSFVNLLAEKREVIMPELFGFNYRQNSPESVDELTDIIAEFLAKTYLADAPLVGHSLGGLVVMKYLNNSISGQKIVLINPVLPTDYEVGSMVVRASYKTGKELLGIEGGLRGTSLIGKISAPFAFNILRKPVASYRLVKNILTQSLNDIHVQNDTLFLYGERDEYFDFDGNESQVRKSFVNLTLKRLSNKNHDWPIFFPEEAKQHVAAHLWNEV